MTATFFCLIVMFDCREGRWGPKVKNLDYVIFEWSLLLCNKRGAEYPGQPSGASLES